MSKRWVSFETVQAHPCFLDTAEYPDWPSQFGNENPIKLEIGFGNGNFLLEMAVREPDCNFIGMDFYHKGIRKVITRLERLKIPNVRLAYGDAKERTPLIFREGELTEILINFPDPWPKKRHHKRRLIKPPFVDQLAQKLSPQGSLRVATDYAPYAEEILECLNAHPNLRNQNPNSGYADHREDTPRTKYEKTFINAGKTIFYLDFIKQAEVPQPTSTEPALVN